MWESSSPPAVAIDLGGTFRPSDNGVLLAGIAAARRRRCPLVLVHHGAGGGSLVRVAAREDAAFEVRTVELTSSRRGSWDAVELALSTDSPHVTVDAAGGAWRQAWSPVELPAPQPWHGSGWVLVTGGLGGLGLRAAVVLARVHSMRPLLLDVRRPTRHQDLLKSVDAVVAHADLTDPGSVRAALSGVDGPIVALVHCAGTLLSRPVEKCDAHDLASAQAPKVTGLHVVLDAIDGDALRHLITFGSITAHDPHAGMGSYALANELLRRATLRRAIDLPHCSTVAAEWSLWSGAGLAHEYGAVAQARRMGMRPISLRDGMRTLLRLLHWPAGPEHAAAIRLD